MEKEKKQAAKVVKSNTFQWIFGAFGILFIILTYFIAVTPDSFLAYGYPGIFFYNVFSSSLLIMGVLVEKFNLYLVVLFSALGNIPNTSVNYLVGYSSKSLFSNNPIILKLKKWMERFGLWVVFVLAVIPFPIDINGLLSGYVGIPYRKYIMVTFLGKLLILYLVAIGVVNFAKAMS